MTLCVDVWIAEIIIAKQNICFYMTQNVFRISCVLKFDGGMILSDKSQEDCRGVNSKKYIFSCYRSRSKPKQQGREKFGSNAREKNVEKIEKNNGGACGLGSHSKRMSAFAFKLHSELFRLLPSNFGAQFRHSSVVVGWDEISSTREPANFPPWALAVHVADFLMKFQKKTRKFIRNFPSQTNCLLGFKWKT